MATIPIEVIVQDAEAPIVPSEDGTNTNTNTEATVAVPDTGSGIGNIFTSSASSIILPAILLVLAIGSIVAILIHKYHKQKKDKTSKKEKLAMAATSTIAVLAATVLISNLVIPVTKAATSDITDGITPAEDKVSITVTRDGSSAEESIESTATITSTSDFGYKVLLSMAEGVETNNLYLDGNEDSEYCIAPVEASDEEGAELADNTWGYALEEGTNYTAVPLLDSAATVAQGDEPVEDELLSIYYGVKVSSDLPAGTYSGGEMEYTLQPSTGFPDSLAYMQDMTPEICAAAPTPGNQVTDPVPTATLIDIRDNKTYTIAKLADGNCWMTQNLDLDLSTDVTLTPANTNITSDWTPAKSTIALTDGAIDEWSSSFDPGDIYYYTSNSSENDIRYNSLAECEEAGHADCSHYHTGNYYEFKTAIASNDISTYAERYGNADTSICPAGWRLPEGPTSMDKYYTEIVGMVQEYNTILNEELATGCGGGCKVYNYLDGGFNAIRTNPFWLARSGEIMPGGRTISNPGIAGEYWSSTFYSSDAAYVALELNKSEVYSGDRSYPSYYNLSIRCLAQ